MGLLQPNVRRPENHCLTAALTDVAIDLALRDDHMRRWVVFLIGARLDVARIILNAAFWEGTIGSFVVLLTYRI